VTNSGGSNQQLLNMEGERNARKTGTNGKKEYADHEVLGSPLTNTNLTGTSEQGLLSQLNRAKEKEGRSGEK